MPQTRARWALGLTLGLLIMAGPQPGWADPEWQPASGPRPVAVVTVPVPRTVQGPELQSALDPRSGNVYTVDTRGLVGGVTVPASVFAVGPDGDVLWRRQVPFNGTPSIVIEPTTGRLYLALREYSNDAGARGFVIAIDPAGSLVWVNPFIDGSSIVTGLAADPVSGGVVAVGYDTVGSGSSEVLTIGFGADGQRRWSRNEGPLERQPAIAHDPHDAAVALVAGNRIWSRTAATGQQRWTTSTAFVGVTHDPQITVDPATGTVYVARAVSVESEFQLLEWATQAVGSDGSTAWLTVEDMSTSTYAGDTLSTIALGAQPGTVYISGTHDPEDTFDYDPLIIAYGPGGQERWRTYHRGARGGSEATGSLAVDPDSGIVYLTSCTGFDETRDGYLATVSAYTPQGRLQGDSRLARDDARFVCSPDLFVDVQRARVIAPVGVRLAASTGGGTLAMFRYYAASPYGGPA